MGEHRKWSDDQKLAIILDGLRGKPAVEICKEYGISSAQYYKWRDEALDVLKNGLRDKRSRSYRSQDWNRERDRLVKVIGEQQLIIDTQKKISKML